MSASHQLAWPSFCRQFFAGSILLLSSIAVFEPACQRGPVDGLQT
jgi:hypothetical protein